VFLAGRISNPKHEFEIYSDAISRLGLDEDFVMGIGKVPDLRLMGLPRCLGGKGVDFPQLVDPTPSEYRYICYQAEKLKKNYKKKIWIKEPEEKRPGWEMTVGKKVRSYEEDGFEHSIWKVPRDFTKPWTDWTVRDQDEEEGLGWRDLNLMNDLETFRFVEELREYEAQGKVLVEAEEVEVRCRKIEKLWGGQEGVPIYGDFGYITKEVTGKEKSAPTVRGICREGLYKKKEKKKKKLIYPKWTSTAPMWTG